MKLIYIDESGQTGTKSDPDQPLHLLSAVIVDDLHVRSIEDAVRTLGYKHFGAKSGNTDFEFHGHEIRSGKGYFKGTKVENRVIIVHELIDILMAHDSKIGYAVVDKSRSRASQHPHQLAFLLLVERIEDHLKAAQSLGLLVADENDDMEQRLIDDLEVFKTESTRFGWRPTKIEHVIDSIHFVQSRNNRLMQLADVVAFFLLRGRRVRDELFARYVDEGIQSSPHFPEWIESKATISQKTDMAFFHRLTDCPPLVFSKVFPE